MKIHKTLLVFAMSRSGHHAIIDWLYAQYKNNKIFLNYGDITKPFINFENRVQYYYNDNKYYKKISASWKKYNLVEEKLLEFKKEDSRIVNEVLNEDKNLCIINFENPTLPQIQKYLIKFVDIHNSNIKTKCVLVLRDILNIIASKIKSERELSIDDLESKKIDSIVSIWKEYANEFLKVTRYLESPFFINYNAWFSDINYREEISNNLGTDTCVEQWNELSTFGGGSSFDQYKYKKRASDMKVLDRWKKYSNLPSFMNIWNNDSELQNLSRKIFGKLPYDTEDTNLTN